MSLTSSLIRRPTPFIIVVTLLAGVAALVVAWSRPVRYETSISFAVNRINQGPTDQYEYDGYYAIQAADLFSQTVVSWFSTPSVLREVYDNAGLSVDVSSLNSLVRRFSTKKEAAQNIIVTFAESTEERAAILAEAVTTTMQERAAALNQTADETALFEIVGTNPLIVATRPNLLLYTFAGLLAGFLVALSTVSVLAYLRALPTEA
ncbi:MAG: hypothetical protein HYZ09_03145 [Candidatus Kerfeldbacteria bacterium]|nr:hypothetical protein [Candidatus Kerfeldbacteria bacterium]